MPISDGWKKLSDDWKYQKTEIRDQVSWQVFQRLEKCSTFQHGDPSKTEPFDRRGADFPILGRFRLAESQSVYGKCRLPNGD
jgi:hypothetical protein